MLPGRLLVGLRAFGEEDGFCSLSG